MLGLGLSTSKVSGAIGGPNDGWLKIDMDGNDQSGLLSGIRKPSMLTGHTKTAGDYWTMDCLVYLENTGGGNCWGGVDNVLTYGQYGGYGSNHDIPQDAIEIVDMGPSNGLPSGTYIETGNIYFPISGDRPAGCAVWYIKDIVWKVFNAGGVLLNTYTSDFTSTTDGWQQYSGTGTMILTANATVPS